MVRGDAIAMFAALAEATRDPQRPCEHAPVAPITMLSIFSFLFAGGILFHELILENYHGLWSPHTVLWLAALWCLLGPASMSRFLVLSIASVITIVNDMPFVVNHAIPWLLIALASLVLWVGEQWRSRRQEFEPGHYYASLARVVRVVTLLVYTFATISKLNSDFFNPQLSAGLSIYRDAARSLPLPTGAWTHWPVIYGTVLLEGGVVLLLCWRTTRMAGLFVALAFHGLMAVAGHIPFSGIALALLFSFVPPELPQRLRDCGRQYPLLAALASRLAAAARQLCTFVALAGLSILYVAGDTYGWFSTNAANVLSDYLRLLYYPYLFALTGVLAWCCYQGLDFAVGRRGACWRESAVVLAAAAVIIANGLCPYLGLKTQNSFTMYSNLQTEDEQWNHLIIPQAIRVFHFQDDLVRIVRSSDSRLNSDARTGTRWVHFEFLRYVSERPDIAVSYEFRGKLVEVARVADDAELSQRPNRLLRRILYFRPVPAPESNTIQH